MRPIRRGPSPQPQDFNNNAEAKGFLLYAIGEYCSYCERPLPVSAELEHIIAQNNKPELKGKWENFLIACKSCNATKKDKNVEVNSILLPDRDNTFLAFSYLADGTVVINQQLSINQKIQANALLELVGLQKETASNSTPNIIVQDRQSKRMEAWSTAKRYKKAAEQSQNNPVLKNTIIELIKSTGFFSIWMTVFEDLPEFKVDIIKAFKSTEQSGCFNMKTAQPISPAPNPDKLESGGKV